MADGGIHDQLGGGFHRYATDAIWLVPHFEKMLYDNAQLARVYIHAWQADRRSALRATWRGTPSSTCSATCAGPTARSRQARTPTRTARKARRSSGRPTRSARFSGPTRAAFLEAYGVTDEGNWEGATILSRIGPRGDEAAEQALAAGRERLLAARQARPQPARDDKALAGWNGLAIAALADASRAFAGPDADRYRGAAEAAASALLAGLLAAGWTAATVVEGRTSVPRRGARGLRASRGRPAGAL